MKEVPFQEAIKQQKFDAPQTEAAINVIFTANFLEHLMRRLLKEYEITHEQFNVLRILRGNYPGAYELNEIEDRMLNRWSNVSRLVEKLRKRGFLTRQPKQENRRKVEVRITDEGRQFLKDVDQALIIGDLWKQSLSEKEARTLSDLLDKLRINLSSALNDRTGES